MPDTRNLSAIPRDLIALACLHQDRSRTIIDPAGAAGVRAGEIRAETAELRADRAEQRRLREAMRLAGFATIGHR
jgi:hypothetical protein